MADGKAQMGRPPEGSVKLDGIEKVRAYPKLALSVRPCTRAKLNAAAAIEDRAAWLIVDEAINLYVDQMPATDRKMVEEIVNRNRAK